MMNLRFLCMSVMVCLSYIAQAQGPSVPKDNPTNVSLVQDQLDSIVLHYFIKKNLEQRLSLSAELDSLTVPDPSDSILELRLDAVNSYIPLDYNDKTKAFIKMYTQKKRELVPYLLGLSEYYFPMFEAELDKQGLPLELKYLPVIESALKPQAVSRAGAVGLWQFMYGTGKYCGLTITSYVDERRDPLRASEAACSYLKELHGMFGDWHLAIAAYNCGPGNVNKAIRRSGGRTNFWEIYNYLPRETRGYVPAFIAAAYVFNYYEEHNIGIAELELPRLVDTVEITRKAHLEDIAEEMDLSLELVRQLNPQYRVDVVPASEKRPYKLILPMESCLRFSDCSDMAFELYGERSKGRTTAPASYSSRKPASVAGKAAIYYTVKSGDNLGYIADWFDTYVSSIKSWNGMYSSNIRVGKKLLIYVPKDKESFYKSIDGMTFTEKKNISSHSSFASTSTKTSTSQTTTSSNASSGNYVLHTFRSGESLWELCQKYPGNTVNEVMRINGISNVRNIKVGQTVKFKKN